jgi:hypothetical protein
MDRRFAADEWERMTVNERISRSRHLLTKPKRWRRPPATLCALIICRLRHNGLNLGTKSRATPSEIQTETGPSTLV